MNIYAYSNDNKNTQIICFCVSFLNIIGKYPLEINMIMSPPGNHMLKIYVEDDEDFRAESTVQYFIKEGTTTTGY